METHIRPDMLWPCGPSFGNLQVELEPSEVMLEPPRLDVLLYDGCCLLGKLDLGHGPVESGACFVELS